MSASIDSIILGLFKLFGSIGVFLFGMKIMSDGIQKVAGERLQKILHIITNNRFTAVLTGFLITAIIQSSSATTVMVVSFVNADLLTLTQSIGVIMGANIGTTVTGWIVSIFGFKVKISVLALPIIGIGFPFIFSKVFRRRYIGEIFIGFGLLFLGLEFMKDSVPNINDNMEALRFLTEFTNKGFLSRIIFIIFGTVITCVIQSSSAAMAMTLAMADAGWIDVIFSMQYHFKPDVDKFKEIQSKMKRPESMVLMVGNIDRKIDNTPYSRDPKRLAELIQESRELSRGNGIAVYNYGMLSELQIKYLRRSVFTHDATPKWLHANI